MKHYIKKAWQLKKAYVERVVDNGFDDAKIYNDNLLKLDYVDYVFGNDDKFNISKFLLNDIKTEYTFTEAPVANTESEKKINLKEISFKINKYDI